MLQCIDDTTNGDVITFIFSDQSEVTAIQQHHESPPSFKLQDPDKVSLEQKQAITAWSACPIS